MGKVRSKILSKKALDSDVDLRVVIHRCANPPTVNALEDLFTRLAHSDSLMSIDDIGTALNEIGSPHPPASHALCMKIADRITDGGSLKIADFIEIATGHKFLPYLNHSRDIFRSVSPSSQTVPWSKVAPLLNQSFGDRWMKLVPESDLKSGEY